MALVLETGTCVPAANALVSRAGLIAYAADYYPAITVADDTGTDAAIMRATAWISSYPIWDGERKCGRAQGTAFPRTGMTDCDGNAIPDNAVPVEVQTATYLASLAELVSPGVLTPTVIPGRQVKRVKVDVIEQEFMTPKDQGVTTPADPAATLRPVLTAVADLLKCLATLPDGKAVPWPWVA